jgi:hypothetical protein
VGGDRRAEIALETELTLQRLRSGWMKLREMAEKAALLLAG